MQPVLTSLEARVGRQGSPLSGSTEPRDVFGLTLNPEYGLMNPLRVLTSFGLSDFRAFFRQSEMAIEKGPALVQLVSFL